MHRNMIQRLIPTTFSTLPISDDRFYNSLWLTLEYTLFTNIGQFTIGLTAASSCIAEPWSKLARSITSSVNPSTLTRNCWSSRSRRCAPCVTGSARKKLAQPDLRKRRVNPPAASLPTAAQPSCTNAGAKSQPCIVSIANARHAVSSMKTGLCSKPPTLPRRLPSLLPFESRLSWHYLCTWKC